MSEIRRDPVTGVYTIIAPDRAKRPNDFEKRQRIKKRDTCPFCHENNQLIPSGANFYDYNGLTQNTDSWKVKVIPNKYPIVDKSQIPVKEHMFYQSYQGYGIHEVIIDHPNHNYTIADFSLRHIHLILKVLRDRYKELNNDSLTQYIQIFKNHGGDAGASLLHPHWQVIALPIIPNNQKKLFDRSKRYYEDFNECIFCKIIDIELHDKKRIIDENNDFITFAPFASRFNYETWIIPKMHIYHITDLNADQLYTLSVSFKNLLYAYEKLDNDLAYNICIMSGEAKKTDFQKMYHWHIQIIPRSSSFAGLELSTGMYINSISPEVAAGKMREILVSC